MNNNRTCNLYFWFSLLDTTLIKEDSPFKNATIILYNIYFFSKKYVRYFYGFLYIADVNMQVLISLTSKQKVNFLDCPLSKWNSIIRRIWQQIFRTLVSGVEVKLK